jgi:pimeloyl-ACP methyl ester carboxylesterase
MLAQTLVIDDSRLEYYVYNEYKDNPVICFPGFGQTAGNFGHLAQLNLERKIIGVNLFAHGQSVVNEDNTQKARAILTQLITELLALENIVRFDLSGYSLGARYALSLFGQFSEQIDHLYLLAPDGIKGSFWFNFATRTRFQRRVFKYMLNNSSNLISLTKTLTQAGLIPTKRSRFVEQHLRTSTTKDLVYNAWVASKAIQTPINELTKLLKSNRTQIHLILAINDPVIPNKSLIKWAGQFERIDKEEIPVGHAKLSDYNFLNPKD